ncbi:MAG: sugar ABC transporter substrate-binding protein, partial [Alphaproteobacteria bacterium]
MMTRLAAASAVALLAAGAAQAGCGIKGGRINVLANDFPALRAVVDEAAKCAGDGVTFARNHTAKHREISVPALTA